MQQVLDAFKTLRYTVTVRRNFEKPFEYSDKQKEARAMIISHPESDNFLMVGGSRSGKTFLSVALCITRARMFPRSRHLICRLRFNHAKASIWLDTLPKVLRKMNLVKGKDYWMNKTDYVITFSNGSELWVDGLDDANRVEKMLGREYNTIYFNEISQISWDSITTMISRLALQSISEKWGECRNYCLFDCNPPSKRHWSYQLWFRQRDPETRLPLAEDQVIRYQHIQMNPSDNLQNLSKGYLDKLKALPERKRKRFLEGEYSDVEGAIFNNWDTIRYVPEDVKEIAKVRIGCDYGFTADFAAAVRIWFIKRKVGKSRLYIEELTYEKGLTNKRLMRSINTACESLDKEEAFEDYKKSGGKLLWQDWNQAYVTEDHREVIQCMCDGAEPKDVFEMQEEAVIAKMPFTIIGVRKKTEVITGIDWLEDLEIYVTERSEHVIEELEAYEWKKDSEGQALPEPIDKGNHTIDAIRYACHEFIGNNYAQLVPLSVY
jgi:PBSX family phage terminase large subunit